MSQAGITSLAAAGAVTSVTGNDGLTANPTTGAVQLFTRGTGTRNMWLGETSGPASAPAGSDNTGLGYNVLNSLTDGVQNVAVGSTTLEDVTLGNLNVAVGTAACANVTSGSGNTALGDGALGLLLTGSSNVAVGNSAGNVYTGAESNNILIGQNTGVVGESNTIRIGTSQQTSAYIIAPLYAQRPIVTQSGTNTFALTDGNTFQLCTSGSAMTLTVPLNATVAFPVGTEIDVYQQGAGQVSIAATGGVTINSAFGNLKIAAQYTGASLKKTATNTWELYGNLTA
jgi:hypothetical protein